MTQHEDCKKCEEWPLKFVVLICSVYAIGFCVGGYFCYTSSFMAAIGYVAMSMANLFGAFYTTCRHCYYYGKRCYMGAGLLIPYIFEKDDAPISLIKEGIWMAVFTFSVLYPVIFIFKEYSLAQSFVYSIGYLVFPAVVILLVNSYCCPKCKNEGCYLNPDRNKAEQFITLVKND